MTVRKVSENVKWIGAIDWDRRLFDELIPLPDGTSYNSYFVEGSEKNMLIDSIDPTKREELMNNLRELGVETIDYVVANHGEQDHSGSLRQIIDEFGAEVLVSERGKDTITSMVDVDSDETRVVEDGEEISLGDLDVEFMIAPWVHWPDTMFTYLKQDDVLFSCDYLGAHYATSKLFVDDFEELRKPAKRYFAEIMMPFASKSKSYIEDIRELEPEIVAPSHGPLYDNPKIILDAYSKWVNDKMKNKVVIPYVSMHGSTEKMVEYLTDSLIDEGVEVEIFHMTSSDIGELAMALVDAATLIVGSPMVLGGAHPVMFYVSYLANALKPNTKYLSVVGSFGWGGRMIDQLSDNTKALSAELIEPVTSKGYPDNEDLKSLDELAQKIAQRHEDNENVV